MFQHRTPINRLLNMKLLAGSKAVEATATGNPLVFTTDIARPLKSLLIPFTPQQEGTGDPSPENIRDFVPWNGLKVFGGGKNIFDSVTYPLTEDKWISSSNGDLNTNTTSGYACTVDFIPCVWLRGQKITLNHRPGKSAPGFAFYAQDKTFITGFGNNDRPKGEAWTITVPNDAVYMRFTTAKETKNETQIELGESASAYEAPNITDTDISFPSPVYGGTLDVVSGVLTVEWVEIVKTWGDFSNKTSLGDNTRGTLNISSYPSKPSSAAEKGKCNIAPWNTGWSTDSIHFYTNEGSCIVFLPNDTDASTEIQVVYPLATPQEIPLTGAQITALVGNNTIWSDADGSMTAVYLKKG